MFNVTFVCTGNTCRSAMAEGLFKKILKDRGITDITCHSCGLAAYTGDEASPQAVEVCRGVKHHAGNEHMILNGAEAFLHW